MADNDPTADEIKSAQEIMRRAADATQREAKVKMKPISDITASPEFAKVKQQLDDLPLEFMGDMNFAPHIMAAKAGLNGLATVAPPPAPVVEPSPAA